MGLGDSGNKSLCNDVVQDFPFMLHADYKYVHLEEEAIRSTYFVKSLRSRVLLSVGSLPASDDGVCIFWQPGRAREASLCRATL